MRAKQALAPETPDDQPPTPEKPAQLDRRRWAMLIKNIYHADPFLLTNLDLAYTITSVAL
jgi:hypothetical protein